MRLSNMLIPLSCMALIACSDSDDDKVAEVELPAPQMNYEFTVEVKNLTQAQPLSPITVGLHQSGELWKVGESASVVLEQVAEGGDNSALLSLSLFNQTIAGEAPLMPGAAVNLSLTTPVLENQKISVISMMVNTNDGFTGLNALDVSAMDVGEVKMYSTYAYDAGTEINSEMAGTIPGPADGGEGFNAARDDVDYVSMHPGVVSNDDGLSQSILSGYHKFDNPLMTVSITRTK